MSDVREGTSARSALKDLKELGEELGILDATWIDVFAKRSEVGLDVGAYKDAHGKDKIREEIEEERINMVGQLAKIRGLDRHFAEGVMWQLIADSCRVQIRQTERFSKVKGDGKKDLKQNLKILADAVAPVYEENYGQNAPCATKMTKEYEKAIISNQLSILKAKRSVGVALDLGCATGLMSRHLAGYFSKVYAVDLSPGMLEKARTHPDHSENITYIEHDFDHSMPSSIRNGSVNFVVMNMGTASDVIDFRQVLARIKEKLAPEARFLFSFYNESAWVQNWFLPWVLPLRAKIDERRHELEVDVLVKKSVVGEDSSEDNSDELVYKRFPIFAKPYTHDKAIAEMSGLKFKATTVSTYPTVASILPEAVLSRQSFAYESIREIDGMLASDKHGAYLITAGSVDKGQ